jgi:hypothetical protein
MIEFLEIIGVGGIIASILAFIFHWLSQKRQFRQSLNHKMIDRISYLVEHYYGQISSSSETLRQDLKYSVSLAGTEATAEHYLRINLYNLLAYLHQVERLTRERPRPLFTEIKAERDYIQCISDIYQNLPFDLYDISFLLSRYRSEEAIVPVHDFLGLIDKDEKLKQYYERFSDWLTNCSCNDITDDNCKIHSVVNKCYEITTILEEQIQKMYRLWYKKSTEKS